MAIRGIAGHRQDGVLVSDHPDVPRTESVALKEVGMHAAANRLKFWGEQRHRQTVTVFLNWQDHSSRFYQWEVAFAPIGL